MDEENTEYKIPRKPRNPNNPTTVRVGAVTRAFMREHDDMPLTWLVNHAPGWYQKAQEGEDYRRNMEKFRAEVIRLTNENLELMRFKQRTTERIKDKGLVQSLVGEKTK